MSGREARRQRLRKLIEERGVAGVVLRRYPNFAWYTGGADNRVDHSSPAGVAAIVVTGDGEYCLTDSIEARRIRDEQTPDIEVVDYPWYEDSETTLRRLVPDGDIGSDLPQRAEQDLADSIQQLRLVLDDEAIELYRVVGRDTAEAMESVATSLQPGMSEDEAAGALLEACRTRGMSVPVVMAAGDDRISLYRHAILHPGTFHRRIMLVVCAERGGVYANLTRFVEFEQRSRDLEERFEACETILRRLREEATRPGRRLGEAFEDCTRYYAEAGFPDEWKLHHQGGMTGYATREFVAKPGEPHRIETGQAFAWNPSITGAKAEETFVLTPSGPEILTPR